MDKWQHLFVDGEYAAREKILSDLTLEQVTFLPSRLSHSIYDELALPHPYQRQSKTGTIWLRGFWLGLSKS